MFKITARKKIEAACVFYRDILAHTLKYMLLFPFRTNKTAAKHTFFVALFVIRYG